jgi:hypothetical protein
MERSEIRATTLKLASPRKTKDVDGRVKPGLDDPNSGLRIFVAEDTPRRTASRIGRDLVQQYQR